MKWIDSIWKAVYLVLLAVIMSYCWISFRMEVLSPLVLNLPFFILAVALTGALVYLFERNVRKSFYECAVMCVIACVIIAVFFYLPTYQGILDVDIGVRRALDSFIMGIFAFPFSFAGTFVAAYIFPE
ncbi:MAG: hypothetical protein HXS44_04080 [Theionarchaea archaeon]|nr:hypothetical protein [Theionarchaea archaeon]